MMSQEMQMQKNPPPTPREALKLALKVGRCQVKFEKADGSHRNMFCTQDPSRIPWPDNPVEAEGKIRKKNEDENLFVVWDFDQDGWRSFRFERIIEWETEREL